MEENSILEELKYIDKNFEFSDECTKSRQEFILSSGLVEYYDGTLMLTNQGELAVGYNPEDIGLTEDSEEDITESFFYNDMGDKEDEYF